MDAAFYVSYGLLWALLLFQGVVLLGVTQTIYRRHSPGAERAEAAGTLRGELVPAFEVVDLAGRTIDNEGFLGRTTAVLFVSPSCESCAATLDEMAMLVEKSEGSVIVVCRSSADRCQRLAEMYGVDVPVVADTTFRVSKAFGVTRVPTAVLVNEEGRVQSYGHPMRGEDLVEILDSDGATALYAEEGR